MKVQLMNLQRFALRKTSKGFSLPEVAIAVGIAAFALVSLMGVIPAGLDSVRMAGQISASARMIAQVNDEIQVADWGDYSQSSNSWSKLQELLGRRWYFDDQANSLQLGDPDFNMRLTYVVRATQSATPVLLPGGTAPTRDLKSFKIDIAQSTNPSYAFDNPRLYQTVPSIVSRQYTTGAIR